MIDMGSDRDRVIGHRELRVGYRDAVQQFKERSSEGDGNMDVVKHNPAGLGYRFNDTSMGRWSGGCAARCDVWDIYWDQHIRIDEEMIVHNSQIESCTEKEWDADSPVCAICPVYLSCTKYRNDCTIEGAEDRGQAPVAPRGVRE